jgi:GNAT superfamily N-acetyltransferase
MSNHWSVSVDSAFVRGVGVLRISADTCSAANLNALVRWSGAGAVGVSEQSADDGISDPSGQRDAIVGRRRDSSDKLIPQRRPDRRRGRGAHPAGEITVAWIDGTTVGYVRIRRLDGDTSEFGMLAAAPDQRGIGVGWRLVEFAERWSLETGRGDLLPDRVPSPCRQGVAVAENISC